MHHETSAETPALGALTTLNSRKTHLLSFMLRGPNSMVL